MMEKILLNLLLFLGIVWMLLGIVYFCFRFFPLRQQEREKRERETRVPSPERRQKTEENAHILVGRSKSFISSFIPEVPAVFSSEKAIENPNTFAVQNAQTERQAAEDMEVPEEEESNMEEGENEMQVAYTMDEPDEDAIVREELQIADDAMPDTYRHSLP